MRILLQKRGDSLYVKGDGEWTTNHKEAARFDDTDDAVAYCIANDLPNMQVVMKFENSLYDISLPLQDRVLQGRSQRLSQELDAKGSRLEKAAA